MRSVVLALAVLAGGTLLAGGSALARTKLLVRTTTYSVSGRTGVGLIQSMDRKGPRHGFTTRAIAQTGYTVGWRFNWERRGAECRLAEAEGTLDMTYTYPKAGGPMSADLRRRWDRFMAGVRRHEETHGALAKAMVAAAERSVKGLRRRSDPNCRATQAEALRRVGAVYKDYEARQLAFDRREHRDGGNVERLMLALAGRG